MGDSRWRPPQAIRAISIALIRRDDELLLMAVRDDSGKIQGWRPPGGAIEFGEFAEAALEREIREELGERIRCLKRLCVLENVYVHEDSQGHEIVFVFEAQLVDSPGVSVDRYTFRDGGVDNEVVWRRAEQFKAGIERLFPEELLQYVD